MIALLSLAAVVVSVIAVLARVYLCRVLDDDCDELEDEQGFEMPPPTSPSGVGDHAAQAEAGR